MVTCMRFKSNKLSLIVTSAGHKLKVSFISQERFHDSKYLFATKNIHDYKKES